MSDFAIRVENLGKSYLVGHDAPEVRRYTALRDVIARNARNLARKTRDMARGRPIVQGDEVEEFWALKDVSFELRRGETLGVIGRNGAGKSTLLKVLSRITEPTTGRVTLDGRAASLLEVGTGFHPELTGRENIFLNAAILGMSRRETARYFDEIVAFAEIARFIDTPVKRYSSGMYVRLAFSVAAHLQSEILIVDEVLAVGDAEFQNRCIGKLRDATGKGRTVVLVSHNMTAISGLCDSALLLDGGIASAVTSVPAAVAEYLARSSTAQAGWVGELGNDCAELLAASVRPEVADSWFTSERLVAVLTLRVKRPVHGLIVGWELRSLEGQRLAYTVADDMKEPPALPTAPGTYQYSLEIPPNVLAEGAYSLAVDLGIHHVELIVPKNAIELRFSLQNVNGIGRRYPTTHWRHVFRPDWNWHVQRMD